MTTTTMTQKYEIYACLPFVALTKQATIQLGPVILWPASRYQEHIEQADQQNFWSYLQSISQVKTRIADNEKGLINTKILNPEELTCLSIDSNVPLNERESLLIDSLYLLYYTSTCKDLYLGHEIPPFAPFRKMIPAAIPFIRNSATWENLFIPENHREDTICLLRVDQELCSAFGKILNAIYDPSEGTPKDKLDGYERIIRSIRHLVDRFFPRFVNLVKIGLTFTSELYNPEDIIFLVASFEALLDIDHDQMASDFKKKLRPLLNFKYAKPLELFWKWVDDLYEVRRKIIRGGTTPDSYFRGNPTFKVLHLLIGIKIFIYAVNTTLSQVELLSTKSSMIPLDDIMIYFWTEESLLRKMERYLLQWEEKQSSELENDISGLAELYVQLHSKRNTEPGCQFIPTPKAEIEGVLNRVQEILKRNPRLELPPLF